MLCIFTVVMAYSVLSPLVTPFGEYTIPHALPPTLTIQWKAAIVGTCITLKYHL